MVMRPADEHDGGQARYSRTRLRRQDRSRTRALCRHPGTTITEQETLLGAAPSRESGPDDRDAGPVADDMPRQ